MIFPHVVLLISLLSPVLSTLNHPVVSPRIHEARARSLAHRTRLREQAQRFASRFRASTPSPPSRSKRQYPPENYVAPYPGQIPQDFIRPYPLPPPYQSYGYNQESEEEPVLVHICSVEDDDDDDYYARNAEDKTEDLHSFPRDAMTYKRIVPKGANNHPISKPNGHITPPVQGHKHKEEDNKKPITKFEQQNPRNSEDESQRPNSKSLKVTDHDGQIHQQETDQTFSQKNPEIVMQQMRNHFQEEENKKLTESREAEAHLHSHSKEHTYQKIHSHGHGGYVNSHTTTSGFHVPQAHIATPGVHLPHQGPSQGVNLNINQNQGFHSNVHNQGAFSTHNPSIPSHKQPIFFSRNSVGSEEKTEKVTDSREAEAHLHSHSKVHTHQKIHSHGHGGYVNSHITTSGFHVPQTHIATPGGHLPQHQVPSQNVNLNINQNQGFHSNVPNQGGFSTHKPSIPSHGQPIYFARNSVGENDKIDSTIRTTSEEKSEKVIDSREATPTLHKKLKKQPTYYPQYPTYNQYHSHRYRESGDSDEEEPSEEIFTNDPEDREAKPTVNNVKHELGNQYHEPHPPYGGYSQMYKEAEDENIDDQIAREASPTLKKLKKKKKPQYYQPYPSYNTYSQHYGNHGGSYYREAGEDANEDIREANPEPTIKELIKLKKLKKMTPQYYPSYPSYNMMPQYNNRHYGYYRAAEDNNLESRQPDDIFDERISSPFLFDVPARRFSNQYRRSIDKELDSILGTQRDIVDSLKEKSHDDEDLKLVWDIGNRTLSDVEAKRKNITKRSIPLSRLITDPHAKLDVPKTIENFGTATKTAFEDERAPMYHLKRLVGSSKNALLSAMKIPPQNMIIPSDYSIVRTSDYVGAEREDEEYPFEQTFKRVGKMLRESIKSSQDTAAHIGDMAHSARNVIHSARHTTPRLIIPYSKVPEVQDTRRKRINKAVLITPRLLDVAHESRARSSGDNVRPDFVRLGHLMDAVGLSNPNSKHLDLHKIILENNKITEVPVSDRLAQLYSRFRNKYNGDVETVSEALSTLEDAKLSVGAENLRDFLEKMRKQLTHIVGNTPDKHKKKKYKNKGMKQQEKKEMGKFIENLFDGATVEKKTGTKENQNKEIVGDSLYLPQELMHPFMGRPSDTELKNFLRDNGDELENAPKLEEKTPKSHFEAKREHQHDHDSNLGYVLGAVNPMMFERLYNETVNVKNNDAPDTDDLFRRNPQQGKENATDGTSMTLNGPMLKPFMGQPQQEVDKFLETYNRDASSEYIEMEE